MEPKRKVCYLYGRGKVSIPHGGLGTRRRMLNKGKTTRRVSPSHTVGLEPWETYSLLLLPHIAIPRGGLGTYVLNLIENYIDTQESPSHPVGLEHTGKERSLCLWRVTIPPSGLRT